VALLLLLATLAGLIGSLALWVDRQALNTEQWTQTSSRLIANREIRDAIVSYAVNQLFARANVDGALRDVLPAAGAASTDAKLRRLARGFAAGVLATRGAQETWRRANTQAQGQLLDILDQRGSATHQNQAVILNLEPLLKALVHALLASDVVRALPGGGKVLGTGSAPGGRLVVLRADQVRKASGLVDAVRGLSVVLPLAAIFLCVAAVALARGWRRVALGRAGVCAASAAVLLLLGRRALAPIVVNALVSESAYRQTGRAAWMIATTGLRDAALVTVILGVVVATVSVVMRLAGVVVAQHPSRRRRPPGLIPAAGVAVAGRGSRQIP
jgi:hypothetical protein